MVLPFFAGSIIQDVQRTDLEQEGKRLEEERLKRIALRKEAKLKGKMNATEFLRKLTGADEVAPDEAFKSKEGEANAKQRPRAVGSFPAPPTSKTGGA